MPATDNRDLASCDLWQDSLTRSRRRRRLAADGRKEHNRRKTASLAVSAAVVAAPAWPSVAGGGRFQAKADAAEGVKPPESRERVLLSFGDRTPTVASLQHKLKIMEDGIFGPQTEAAVRAFQKRHRLPVTGDVDVRTWLTLFPNDAIVASSNTGSGGEPGWSAVTTQPAVAGTSDTTPASVSVATDRGPLGESGASARRKAKSPKAKAASLLPLPTPEDSPADPGGDETPMAPPAQGSPDGAPGPVGGQAPSGGKGIPAPKPVAPTPRPIAPGGSFNDMIEAMIREANRIDRARYNYRWGGGHNSRFTGPYDCSGAVSAVLHAAGLLSSPMVSGGFTRWGARGRGVVTIYANSSHVYMSIRGRFFGTSRANPGGGAGWFNGAPRSGFVVVHVPFERMKPRRLVRTRAHAVIPRKRAKVRMPGGPRYVPRGDSVTGGTTMGTPGAPTSSPAPPVSSPAPTAPTAPVPPPAPVAVPAPGAPAGQLPAAPAPPSPSPLRLPPEVKVPQIPIAPTTPQAPSGSEGTAPPSSGSAPTGSAPATAPAPPAPSGTTTGSDASPPPAPTPTPASSGPVSQLGNKVVEGTGEAVEKVASELPSKSTTPAEPGEGTGGAE